MTEEANREAIGRVLASEPWLVGIRPAGEVVPGMRRELILHAAPAASFDELSPVLQAGVRGAAKFEGLEPSAIELGASRPFETDERVSCVIPGHHIAGREYYADRFAVADDPFSWELEGNCAFVSTRSVKRAWAIEPVK